jgi:hypothetical protein
MILHIFLDIKQNLSLNEKSEKNLDIQKNEIL